jgi:hypothetical protein
VAPNQYPEKHYLMKPPFFAAPGVGCMPHFNEIFVFFGSTYLSISATCSRFLLSKMANVQLDPGTQASNARWLWQPVRRACYQREHNSFSAYVFALQLGCCCCLEETEDGDVQLLCSNAHNAK